MSKKGISEDPEHAEKPFSFTRVACELDPTRDARFEEDGYPDGLGPKNEEGKKIEELFG